MKSVTKLFSIFFLAILSSFTTNAQGTITWPLTANGTANTSTGLTTNPVAIGNGLTTLTYDANDGVTAGGWLNSQSNIVNDEYYEYSIQTSSTQSCAISGISFNHLTDGGNWVASVYYSTDNFATRTIYRAVSSSSTSFSVTNSGDNITISRGVPVNPGTILRFRVYAWNTSGAAKNYTNRNFQITITTPAALPVTLSSFTAKQTTDNNVSLAWVTSSESVNKGFSIERQEEGNGKFQSLGFIPSKAEGGNSQTTLAYSFKDMTAKKGTNMYRLVQEDLDGTKTYSEVRIVKLNGQSVSMVFPNPSNGPVNISRTADGKKMNIQVIDQSGKVISQVNNITDANYKLNIPQSGIYSIKMTYPETGEQSLQRIVVQK